MVEYNLAKVKVEGSNPFLRKIKELPINLIWIILLNCDNSVKITKVYLMENF